MISRIVGGPAAILCGVRGARLAALTRAAITLAAFAALTLVASGCASLGVRPWERDLLAKPEMAFDSDPIAVSTDEHVYFSKEASSGGRGFGGGGCGCN